MSAGESPASEELQRFLEDFVSLEPLTPEEGVERFLSDHQTEVSESTVEEYRRELSHLLEYCEQHEIEDTTEFDGRKLQDYKIWRRDDASEKDGPLSNKTMMDKMYLLRQFLRFLESIDAAQPGLHEKVDIPELDPGEGRRDFEIEAGELERILSYLEKYEYATREHAIWVIFAATGRRPGGLRSLDVEDTHLDEDPHIEFQSREATTLKKGVESENTVSISPEVADILRDYINENRVDIEEEEERKPLFASSQGRLACSTLRRYIYKWSRPCMIGEDCPDGCDMESCEAAESADCASKCPFSKPPYALRHGYISELRRQGVPITVISDRCDVGEDIIREHYSELSEGERRQLRREELEKHRRSQGGYL